MNRASASRIPEGVRLLGIEVTTRGVFELDRGTRFLFIDRSTIRRCTVRSGFTAERPIVGVVVGLGMIVFGVVLILSMFELFDRSPARMTAGWAAGGGVSAGLGVMMLKHSVRRGFYVELATSSGIRKLTIGTPIRTGGPRCLRQQGSR